MREAQVRCMVGPRPGRPTKRFQVSGMLAASPPVLSLSLHSVDVDASSSIDAASSAAHYPPKRSDISDRKSITQESQANCGR